MNKPLLVTLTLVVALAIPALAATPAQASKNCFLKHSTKHKSFGRVKMFKHSSSHDWLGKRWGKDVTQFVCSTKYGKRIQLQDDGLPSDDDWSALASNPRYFFYAAYFTCGACMNSVEINEMIDLKSGRRFHFDFYVAEPPAFEHYFDDASPDSGSVSKTPMVISAKGSIAYVVSYNAYSATTNAEIPPLCGIVRQDFSGRSFKRGAMLDQLSSCDDAKTLKLHGKRVTWSNAGTPKSAVLR